MSVQEKFAMLEDMLELDERVLTQDKMLESM